MSRSELVTRAFALVALASVVTASACQLGDGSCLRMSDCETGWQCVDGTCRTDEAPAPPADGGSTPGARPTADAQTEPPRAVATADAGDDSAGASSSDGEPTDAASDR